jgi:pullulanase
MKKKLALLFVPVLMFTSCGGAGGGSPAKTSYTVTFDYNYEGGPAATVVNVEKGEKVDKPTDPSRQDYRFQGWFTSKISMEDAFLFDFNQPIYQDYKLYAGWSDDSITPPPTYDEPSVSIHYHREDEDYSKWALWLWDSKRAGEEYQFNGRDDYGAVAAYPVSKWGSLLEDDYMGVIIKSKGSWSKQTPDIELTLSEFNTDENDILHIYFRTGTEPIWDGTVYVDAEGTVKDEIKSASFSGKKQISFTVSTQISKYQIYEEETLIVEEEVEDNKTKFTVNMPDDFKVDLTKEYTLKVKFAKSTEELSLEIGKTYFYDTTEFSNQFNYTGELGAIYTQDSTTFRVWSPLAKSIKLRVYETGTPANLGGSDEYEEHEMIKGEKGTWEMTMSGDQEGKYYTYVVTGGKYINKEIVDPYAKSAGVNGQRGMIVDFSKTNPEGWEEVSPLQIDRKALTVYETHVADVTSSSTWKATDRQNEKKFRGMYEEGTTYTKNGVTVKTGFDHIKELGVNAVQLIPIFDQANDEINTSFNWGYNPLNYNVLEGCYSSDPYDGYARIKEFKELVQAYNKAGMNIIMDVVYNHVNSATGSNFDILVPGYFYRYNSNGTLSNGSGCGNETASERSMMRKFMIDSAAFWAKEYKLGGFRFDLMGLHDITTMNQLVKKLRTINQKICVYGEPWQGGSSTLPDDDAAIQKNGNKYLNFGQFNDQMRDGLIKGGLSGKTETGWITNNATSVMSTGAIEAGIKGITKSDSVTIEDPDKTTNLVTCHDNYTLRDRIDATGKGYSADVVKKMAMLANSVVFTSQGTSFMLAGEEFLRTKGGDDNSYQSSYKVNELDYSLKVENIDMFHNYQKLIKLKQEFDGLHQGKDTIANIEVEVNTNKSAISYKLTGADKKYYIIHVNGLGTTDKFDLSGYTLYLDTLGENRALGANYSLNKYQTIIAYKY